MYQSLLVPVDGSQHSRKALQVAARLIDGCLNVIDTGNAQVNRIVKAGAAADTIRDEAEALGVDAIVIGSRGAGNLSRLVLGSVAYSVLHGAAGGVILVR